MRANAETPETRARHSQGSALARLLQAGMVMVIVLMASAFWVSWYWRDQSMWVWIACGLVLMAHTVVLGAECAIGAWVNRHDPAPRASGRQWLGAWWQEVQEAPLAFAWRLPFCWRQLPDDHMPVSSGLPAVVLVHGFVCNRGFWLPWMRALRGQGIPYVSVNLEPVFGDIDGYLVQIEDAVGRAERLTGQPPVLVGHSMGGLVLRAWLAQQPDPRRVGRIITLGSPHMGTWLGRWSRMANGRQMRLGSHWLTRLSATEAARGASPYAGFTCWYSNTDNIVFPASTATLPGADNRLLEGMAHVALAYHPVVMADALAGLAPARRPL